MKIKPVLHRIVVRPDKVEEADELIRRAKAAGLQVELDKREEKAVVLGTVIDVGNTAYHEFGSTAQEQGVVPGARVQYAKYSGVDLPNENLIILNDEDIIGVVEE